MGKRKWVKEPYKSVLEHPIEPDNVTVTARRPQKKRISSEDIGEFLFVVMIITFLGTIVVSATVALFALWIIRPLSDMGSWEYLIYLLGSGLLVALIAGAISVLIDPS